MINVVVSKKDGGGGHVDNNIPNQDRYTCRTNYNIESKEIYLLVQDRMGLGEISGKNFI